MAATITIPKKLYSELLAAERTFADYLPVLDRMERCDIGCQELRGMIQEQLEGIRRLKENFGPGQQ